MVIFSEASPREMRQPRLILTGQGKLLIEQHHGLFSYETRCVRVRTETGMVTVTGENLVIAFFGTEDMQIEGCITGLALSEERP